MFFSRDFDIPRLDLRLLSRFRVVWMIELPESMSTFRASGVDEVFDLSWQRVLGEVAVESRNSPW